MERSTGNWAVSTEDGVTLGADELLPVLQAHHSRLVDTWRGFTADEWGNATRNDRWSVHQTVRHVADGTERGAAQVCQDRDRDTLDAFDPRSTPDVWLEASEREAPHATIERFERAAHRLVAGAQDRLAAGDDSQDQAVYSSVHWTVNLAHLLWDSWLHERDVLVPMGRPTASTAGEERLVGLYGLLIAALPTMMLDQTLTTAVELTGLEIHPIDVRCAGGSIVCAEAPGAEVSARASVAAAVDSLSGRGAPVDEVLSGAPAELGYFAAFSTS